MPLFFAASCNIHACNMTPQDYRSARIAIGSQTHVANLLGLSRATLIRRESRGPITLEMSIAIRTLTTLEQKANPLSSPVTMSKDATSLPATSSVPAPSLAARRASLAPILKPALSSKPAKKLE